MNLAIITRNFLLLFVAIFFLAIAGLTSRNFKKPEINILKQDSAININTKLIKLFSAGQVRLITDFLWIATILESDIDHYKKKDLNSWMYLRFQSIINLDPKFKMAYEFGGKYLSIVKDDIQGAKKILDLALERFPDSYDVLYSAAFLYAFELNDFEAGAKLYEKLLSFEKAPKYLPSLIAKLKFKSGASLEESYQIVKDFYDNEQEETILKQKLRSDLYAIKAELDLKCLNSGESRCNRTDFYGDKYFYKNGKWNALKPFKKYQLHTKD